MCNPKILLPYNRILNTNEGKSSQNKKSIKDVQQKLKGKTTLKSSNTKYKLLRNIITKVLCKFKVNLSTLKSNLSTNKCCEMLKLKEYANDT